MPKVDLYNTDGDIIGDVELSDDVFGAKVKPELIHQVVKMQLANKRQGTHSTKTRAEVRGGGRKPYRQKGTGRARAGSIRSPLWNKGGVVFGPKPRDYSYTMPKRMRRLAMKGALSTKVEDKQMIVVDELLLNQAKTKEMVQVLKNLEINKKVLILLEDKNESIYKASRNIKDVKLAYVNTLNVYDIMNCDKFLVTKQAAKKVEEVYV